MTLISVGDRESVPPPSYHRMWAKSLHLNALWLVEQLHLLTLCEVAVQWANRHSPPSLLVGRGGRPRQYHDASFLLIALLRVLWHLSYQEVHDWLGAWPALASACGLPTDVGGMPRVPSKAQQCKRSQLLGAPPCELLFILLVRAGVHLGITRGRDLIIDSAPILAWHRADPDASLGHAPAHHPRPLLLGYRVHTVLCRGSGLPLMFQVAPAHHHDAPFARPLLERCQQWLGLTPHIVRLDAGYWGLQLIAWIHQTLGAVAVVSWNPKNQHKREGLPPTWTWEELGKRSSIERFFGRIFVWFHLQRPPLSGWTAIASRTALTYAAAWIIAIAAWQQHRPEFIRSPRRVLAYLWESA